ncbi:MAG: hypothetical protein EPN82_02175 [Bacteroidetes bacterium]|nr:MAG: hypothetical protein EPN82_02175 [Bacteroidota bacterium]
MKSLIKFVSAFIFIILIFNFQSCNEKKNQKKEVQQVIKLTPTEYNDSIVGFQERVVKKVLDFSNNFQMLDTIQRQAKLNDVILEIDNSLAILKQLPPFYGNSKLKEISIKWLNFYRSAFDIEYREVLNIAKKPEGELTENDLIRMNDLTKKVADSELVVYKEFETIQQEFYKQFNIQGKQNELNREIEKSGKKSK